MTGTTAPFSLTEQQLAPICDLAASTALNARTQFEQAVDRGELPAWVLELANQLEKSALVYGAGMSERGSATAVIASSGFIARH